MTDWKTLQNDLKEILITGNMEKGVTLAKNTLSQGVAPVQFFEHCISPTLEKIGKMFDTLEIFLPELIVSAEVAQRINEEVINPAVEASKSGGVKSSGKVLLATVKADLHDIGKNMVALMLRVNGFEVIDLGFDVPPSVIIDTAEKEEVDIIGLSCLLTTCLPYMKDVFDYLEGKGIRKKYSVIIGGAAPTADFAQTVGANAYGESAAEAVTICKEIMHSHQYSKSGALI